MIVPVLYLPEVVASSSKHGLRPAFGLTLGLRVSAMLTHGDQMD